MLSSARSTGNDWGRRNPPPDPGACGRRQRFDAHSSLSHDRFRIWFRSRCHHMQRIGSARQNSLARSRCYHARRRKAWPRRAANSAAHHASVPAPSHHGQCGDREGRRQYFRRARCRSLRLRPEATLPHLTRHPPYQARSHRQDPSRCAIAEVASRRLPVRTSAVRTVRNSHRSLFLPYRRWLPWGRPPAARELCRKSCLCFRETLRSRS